MSDDSFENKNDAVAKRPLALIVDFDYALFNGIDLLREVSTSAFREANVEINDITFLRSFLGRRLNSGVNSILGNEALGKADLVKEAIIKGMDKAIESATPRAAVVDLCRKVLDKGISLAFVTSVSASVIDKIAADLDLLDASVVRGNMSECIGSYYIDVWLRAARAVRVRPLLCTALTATGKSVREALLAGMKASALTVPLIEYQDYSGADLVKSGTVSNLDDIEVLVEIKM